LIFLKIRKYIDPARPANIGGHEAEARKRSDGWVIASELPMAKDPVTNSVDITFV
jgi:hypothetical protein